MGKKNKKNKTDKAGKLPKTIAGVKVPRELRNAGGMLTRLARDPAAREVALSALTAALAVRKDNRNTARKIVSDTGEATGKATNWIGPALTAAAVEAGRLLIDAYESGSARQPNTSNGSDEQESLKPSNGNKRPGSDVAH